MTVLDEIRERVEANHELMESPDSSNKFVEIVFPGAEDQEVIIQYQKGMINFPQLDENSVRREKAMELIDDEDLTINSEGDVYITTYDENLDTDPASQILMRAIVDVYQENTENISEIRHEKL